MTTAIVPRLPMPTELVAEMDARKWKVLCDALYPAAKSAESILMAIDYCKARGLDVFKKPVHIVPMYSSALGRYVETVWPGINEIQITAARTGQWAGMDEPDWGPDRTQTFTGTRKGRSGWEDVSETVTYPEWCAVTVYRLVDGTRYAFTEPVFWLEAYSTSGGKSSTLPTDMWVKRPRGQLQKVAKAASLRAAFPEQGELTAEEMEGKVLDDGDPPAPSREPAREPAKLTPPAPATLPDADPETGETGPRPIATPPSNGGISSSTVWGQLFLSVIAASTTHEEIDEWIAKNRSHLERLKADAPKAAGHIASGIKEARKKLNAAFEAAELAAAEAEADQGAPPAEGPKMRPEEFRRHIIEQFEAAGSLQELDEIWAVHVEPHKATIFPPDLEDLSAALADYQARFDAP